MKADMKLVSVNVGLPRVIMEPVAGRVMLRTLNLYGDRQADLPFMVDQARQSRPIRPNTTTTGSANCPR
jgi:hypothetical protein